MGGWPLLILGAIRAVATVEINRFSKKSKNASQNF